MDSANIDFLAAIAQCSHDAVIGKTCDGTILSWNTAAERMYGYAAGEVIGKSIAILEGLDSGHSLSSILSLFMSDACGASYETTHKKKDGTLIHVSLTLSLVSDSAGAVIGISTISRDITDRKRSEDSLRAGEQFLSNIFESIQEGLVVLDGDLRIIRVNRAFKEHYAAAAPLEGRKCHEALYGIERPCLDCPCVQALNTRKNVHQVASVTDSEGRVCGWNDLYVFPLVDQHSGDVKGVVKYVVNGTQRKRDEDELQDTLARLNSLVEAVPDVVFFKDCEGRLLIVNKAYEQFCGLTRQEIIGKTAGDIFPAASVKKTQEGDESVLATAASDHGQHAVANALGNTRWFDVVKFPVHDAEGKIIGLGGVARDITQQKTSERERDKLKRRLLQAQKMEAIGTLAGGIAHDFNNMLTVIQGYSELLLLDKTEGDRAFDYLQKIMLTAGKGRELVQKLLTFSRKAEIKPVSIDLNRRIEWVKRLLSEHCPKRLR